MYDIDNQQYLDLCMHHIFFCILIFFSCGNCADSEWQCTWCTHDHTCQDHNTCDVPGFSISRNVSVFEKKLSG